MRPALFCCVLLFLFGAGCDQPPPSDPAPAVSQPRQTVVDTAAAAFTPVATTRGQRVYVPVYSHIYHSTSERRVNLAVTLSIRNTDLQTPLTLLAVRYYGSDGALVRRYLEAPEPLAPLAARRYVIDELDAAGGSGASFIVEWRADAPVTPPVVESVMISTASAQGISFVSPGRIVAELGGRDDVPVDEAP